VVLLAGGTGLLGSRIAARLHERGQRFRALVRPASDASELEALGAEIVRGDLRDADSLRPAVEGVRIVVTTVTAVSRVLAGEKTSLREIDVTGNANLVRAAEEAGVERFVFVSFDITPGMAGAPLPEAKRATEGLLARSSMREVIVRPDLFQEIWLSDAVQFDWAAGKVQIFGRGESPHGYVAVDDVAEATTHLALHDDPPREVAFGGPEALTRKEAVARFERALGRPIKRRHIPRAMLRGGSLALRRVKPVQASLMAMALDADVNPRPLPAEPLRELGIEPRPVGAYIDELARGR
jgi:NADH dehydrogenase